MPDETYRHDFYRAGNVILADPAVQVTLTTGPDTICQPCIYLKEQGCTDQLAGFVYPSKDQWNRTINGRILAALGVGEGTSSAAFELCRLSCKLITAVLIREIWKERPEAETERRVAFLLKGLDEYLVTWIA